SVGAATVVPRPWRTVSSPRAASVRIASRTTVRLTRRSSHSSSSDGSLAPAARRPDRIRRSSSVTTQSLLSSSKRAPFSDTSASTDTTAGSAGSRVLTRLMLGGLAARVHRAHLGPAAARGHRAPALPPALVEEQPAAVAAGAEVDALHAI